MVVHNGHFGQLRWGRRVWSQKCCIDPTYITVNPAYSVPWVTANDIFCVLSVMLQAGWVRAALIYHLCAVLPALVLR